MREGIGVLVKFIRAEERSYQANAVRLLSVNQPAAQQDVGCIARTYEVDEAAHLAVADENAESRYGDAEAAASDAMRMSVAIENSQPPPTQKPLIMEIVGLVIASTVSIAPSNAAA